MHLPDDFRDRIRRAFGEPGSAWLDQLPQLHERCVRQWRLTNCRLSPELSYNLVTFADSPEYGAVALKIGVPHPELFSEMAALACYRGRHICRAYAVDREQGALLLERIEPGHDLDLVPSSGERIRVAATMFARLPVPLGEEHGFPIYSQWVSRAFQRARAEGIVGATMLAFIDRAELLYQEIEQLNAARPIMLLHGDLHHKNILQAGHGHWKAIDPKGVAGFPCMEPARFMENELDRVERTERLRCLEAMTAVFSEALGESRRMIAASVFVDSVLSTCWHFEEQAKPDQLTRSLDQCQLFLNHLSSL